MRGVVAVGLPLLILYASALVWIGANVERDNSPAASDAAIVLGAHAFYNGVWNPCLVSRVRQGVRLLQGGRVRRLVLSGGVDREDGVVEADAMRQIALQFGAAPNRLLLETRSTSTAENLRFSSLIMRASGLRRVVIVSDPYHLPRAGLIAQKQGLDYTLSPARDSPCWTRWRYLGAFYLREPIAIFENWLRGAL